MLGVEGKERWWESGRKAGTSSQEQAVSKTKTKSLELAPLPHDLSWVVAVKGQGDTTELGGTVLSLLSTGIFSLLIEVSENALIAHICCRIHAEFPQGQQHQQQRCTLQQDQAERTPDQP